MRAFTVFASLLGGVFVVPGLLYRLVTTSRPDRPIGVCWELIDLPLRLFLELFLNSERRPLNAAILYPGDAPSNLGYLLRIPTRAIL